MTACQNTTTGSQSAATSKHFFDLEGYMAQEINRLQQANPEVDKTAALNGEQSNIQRKDIQFKEELNLFVDSDINRPAWRDKYRVDSTLNSSGQVASRTYTAIEDKLPTRKLEVFYSNGAVDSLFIHYRSGSLITQSERWLSYSPGKGYSIKSIQKRMGSESRELDVKARYK